MARVALVGRPNTGKSALFNRLTGSRRSIVEPTPGITRDRIEAVCRWRGREFTLIDTGGFFSAGRGSSLEQLVLDQAYKAVEQSDLIVFVASAAEGLTHLDEEILRLLARRKNKKPVVPVVNKVDTGLKEADAAEFYALPPGEPALVSALHGRGIGDLLDKIVSQLPADEKAAPVFFTLCLAGRPNVGKSSLANAVLGEPRVIVHDSPGTTRDSVDTPIAFAGNNLVLVDTAGLRKRSKTVQPVEFYSRARSVRAMGRADLILLVLEAPEGVVAQDKRIAGEIQERGKAVIVLANKWDLIPPGEKSSPNKFARYVRQKLPFLDYAPVIAVSARTGLGINRILPAAVKAYQAYARRLPDAQVRKVLQEAVRVSPPPSSGRRRIYFKTVGVSGSSPPTILLKTSPLAKIPSSYLNYLERRLRESVDLEGTPIRFRLEAPHPK